MTPCVSVVMSVYNSDLYIQKSLESILLQTFQDWEFIIIDDCSQDNTLSIISQYALQDPRIRIIRNHENLGVVKSLNIGIELAQGKYIARQDGDDISMPERLALQVDLLDSHPEVGLVGVCAQMIDEEGSPIRVGFHLTSNEEIQKNLLDYNCICGPSIMVKRSCLEKIGNFFSEGLDASEDYDLCLRLAEVTHLININEPVYLYRQHQNSASNTKKYQQVVNKAIALDRAIERRFGTFPSPDKVSSLARDYCRAAVLGYASGDLTSAQHYLDLARKFHPGILEMEEYVEKFVVTCAPIGSTDGTLEFIDGIFSDLFPPTRNLSRIRSRLISRVHMQEVFNGMNQQKSTGVEYHLWAGIKANPTWLLNRGVFSYMIKRLWIGAKSEK
jgi:glycosyltransferase involved in cell wall biosynthesis